MKKFWIVVCVIGVVIFLGYIGKDMDLGNLSGNNTNNTSNSNVITGKNNVTTQNNTSTNTSNQTNNVANNTANNTTNQSENLTNTTENKAENQTENKTSQTTNQTENQVTSQNPVKTIEEVTVSDEDKAKTLAKNTYGSSEGVYFKVEQVEANGVYIISVRDEETTNALAWYTVDVKNQTVK